MRKFKTWCGLSSPNIPTMGLYPYPDVKIFGCFDLFGISSVGPSQDLNSRRHCGHKATAKTARPRIHTILTPIVTRGWLAELIEWSSPACVDNSTWLNKSVAAYRPLLWTIQVIFVWKYLLKLNTLNTQLHCILQSLSPQESVSPQEKSSHLSLGSS